MKFLTQFDKVPTKSTTVGNPEYTECRVRFSPDGNLFLEKGKKINRQIQINSYAASCDVNNIIRRYENGDQLALLRDNTGVYADLSQMPKSIHEAQRLSRNINDIYNGLGSDIKAFYPSINEFCEAFSSRSNFDEFLKNSRDVVKARAEKIKPKESNSNG